MSQPRQIQTDKSTYNEYVKQGLWIPEETPKFFRLKSATVRAKVQVKPRRGEEIKHYDAAVITITNYYN